MTLITILLAIIAFSEITRLVLTHKKSSKRDHFKQKLIGTKKMLWDFEFKLFKTKELREEIRQEYDFMKSRIATLQAQYDGWPEDKDPAEREKIKDQITLAEKDKEKLENQVNGLDLEMYGSKPTNQYPDGVQGITNQIDALREVIGLLKDHIKSLK